LAFTLTVVVGVRESISVDKTATEPSGHIGQRTDYSPLEVEVAAGVLISTDKDVYRAGEPVHVRISNNLAETIYAPTDPLDCSLVTVQRSEAGLWVAQGKCEAEREPPVVSIPAGSGIGGVIGKGKHGAFVVGPIIGPKVTPKLSKPARDLPPAPPPSGQEVNPLQDSAAPPGERKLKLHALESPLGAGNYRIQFRFTIGDVSGAAAKIYSRTFIIQDD
jgi:hypothetical protein